MLLSIGNNNIMNKKIYFCIDRDSYESLLDGAGTFISTFNGTRKAIRYGEPLIITFSIANLSLDLLNCYDVYFCYGKEKLLLNKEKVERLMKNLHRELLEMFPEAIESTECVEEEE